MCNPRKVIVNVARTLQESWQATLAQEVTVNAEVSHIEKKRTRVAMDECLGDLALETLMEYLRDSGWEYVENEFYLPVAEQGVGIYYLPGERCFEARAWGEKKIQATGVAKQEVNISMNEEVQTTGEGTYDLYFREEEKLGRKRAKEDGERKLDQKQRAKREEKEKAAFVLHQEALTREAEIEAGRQLRAAKSLAGDEVESEVKQRLENALPEVGQIISRVVAEVYVRSLKKLAQEKGGRVVHDGPHTGEVYELTIAIPYGG